MTEINRIQLIKLDKANIQGGNVQIIRFNVLVSSIHLHTHLNKMARAYKFGAHFSRP